MIRAGDLRHSVKVERNNPSLNSYGAEVDNWELFALRRASIEPLRGREFFTSKELESEVTHRIKMRWDTKLDTMTTKDRVMYGSQIFDIKSIINPATRNREIEIMAIEKV